MSVDYDLITEIGGTRITNEAASMVYTRYAVAAELARGRRTLEIGCASGIGLGLLLNGAELVVGGDVHVPMLQTAREHYGTRVPLAALSATDLPFRDGSFDFVLFLEATYYVRDFRKALDEIDRVLDAGGALLFVNANPERPDFIRSPHSERYHSAREFRQLLENCGYQVETAGAFAIAGTGGRGRMKRIARRAIPIARRVAEALNLIPNTLHGRARIKRLLFGKLRTMPRELLPDFAPREALTPIGTVPASSHKVIYIVARKRADVREEPRALEFSVPDSSSV
jgi:ubiquinone/menaquinone biosynthesis C-methylase UbiE